MEGLTCGDVRVSLRINCIVLAPGTTLCVVSLDLTLDSLDRYWMPHAALFHGSLEL